MVRRSRFIGVGVGIGIDSPDSIPTPTPSHAKSLRGWRTHRVSCDVCDESSLNIRTYGRRSGLIRQNVGGPLRGVTARFVSRNSVSPFPIIAQISRCPPWRILFLLHGIKLLVIYFQLNSLGQNTATSIWKFRFCPEFRSLFRIKGSDEPILRLIHFQK
jgi:hypothetical protein